VNLLVLLIKLYARNLQNLLMPNRQNKYMPTRIQIKTTYNEHRYLVR
jgi:hypothetical protein